MQREASMHAVIDHGLDRSWRGANDGLSEVAKVRKLMRRFGDGEAGCAPERYRARYGQALGAERARPSEV